eukprot:gnl/MRDRNA2_/MRDRNA2_84114_c0_seq4.p1 gnl/MRDRNA2_/MRDRNA2_84114_c0~~gnl/MRDRNA2_/MRDRNA2_84114_c0_seq4.p1  ORF type:complete len:380 (+),score=15.74 gnl/MRDRNA2_/MRDRNA2_84114_c0_seq4:160-1140(+)
MEAEQFFHDWLIIEVGLGFEIQAGAKNNKNGFVLGTSLAGLRLDSPYAASTYWDLPGVPSIWHEHMNPTLPPPVSWEKHFAGMKGTNGCMWLSQVYCGHYSYCNTTSGDWTMWNQSGVVDPVEFLEGKFNEHVEFKVPEVSKGSFFKPTECSIQDGYCLPQAAYPFLGGKFAESYFNPRRDLALSSIIVHCLSWMILPIGCLVVYRTPKNHEKNQKKFLISAVLSYWLLWITFFCLACAVAAHIHPLYNNDILRDLERFLNLDLEVLESEHDGDKGFGRQDMLKTPTRPNIVCVESGCTLPDGSFSSRPSIYVIVIALTLATRPTA